MLGVSLTEMVVSRSEAVIIKSSFVASNKKLSNIGIVLLEGTTDDIDCKLRDKAPP